VNFFRRPGTIRVLFSSDPVVGRPEFRSKNNAEADDVQDQPDEDAQEGNESRQADKKEADKRGADRRDSLRSESPEQAFAD
jgi:hypothetical protein